MKGAALHLAGWALVVVIHLHQSHAFSITNQIESQVEDAAKRNGLDLLQNELKLDSAVNQNASSLTEKPAEQVQVVDNPPRPRSVRSRRIKPDPAGFFLFQRLNSMIPLIDISLRTANSGNSSHEESRNTTTEVHSLPARRILKRLMIDHKSTNKGPAEVVSPKHQQKRRPFDIPQIECPPGKDGSERFSCPSPDLTNRYRCIEDRALCDGFIDCPNAEDEDMASCMFYKTTKAHLDVLADALLRWARGRY